jgi:hypothetical protein
LEIQLSEKEGGNPINQFKYATCFVCPKLGSGVSKAYAVVFLVFTGWRSEVVAGFLNIGGIVDHHYQYNYLHQS